MALSPTRTLCSSGTKSSLSTFVRLRLDRRLTGIIDSSGVLTLVRKEATERGGELSVDPALRDPFLWLRQITGQVLARLHQDRLGDDVRGDVSLYRGAMPEATTVLAGCIPSWRRRRRGRSGRHCAPSKSSCSRRRLNAMDPIDREVLTLRHCEQLSNDEAATVLGINRSLASEVYIRALKRITVVLAALPGFKNKPAS